MMRLKVMFHRIGVISIAPYMYQPVSLVESCFNENQLLLLIGESDMFSLTERHDITVNSRYSYSHVISSVQSYKFAIHSVFLNAALYE